MTAVETPHDSFRKIITSPILQGLVIVVLAVLLAISTQVPGRFPDPDSFYHAGMAELSAQREFPTTFPWLALTTLAETYADLHFLYHIILVPFIALFGTMPGIRIATIVSVGLLAMAFFALLRALQVRGAFAFTALLLGSSAFMFRANLAKAQGFAFAILFLGAVALARRSRIGVFIAAVFAAWTSSHWPVLLATVGAFAFADVFTALLSVASTPSDQRPWRQVAQSVGYAVTLVLAAVSGVAVAHIVNPYFPGNIIVAKQQIITIALIGGWPEARPGVEWSALPALEFLRAIGYLIPLGIVALIGAAAQLARTVRRGGDDDRRVACHIVALCLLTIALAFLTNASRGHLEFFVPFAVLTIAVGMQPIIAWLWPPRIAVGWRRPGAFRRALSTVTVIVAIGGFAIGAWQAHRVQRANFASGYPAEMLAGTMTWVRENVPEGERIFHASWDDFPFFFQKDRTHTYLVGLDPRFGILADAERFRVWSDISSGAQNETAARIVETFDARYAIALAEQTAFLAALEHDPNATVVYRDDEAAVFALHARE